jgi:uroporphyrin-III C-methyltransferase
MSAPLAPAGSTWTGRPDAERTRPRVGFVSFVGAGPGDPDLITIRGARALARAEVVLYDSLVDPRQIEGLSARLVFVGKRCGRHSMPQERIEDLLVRYASEGQRVVRLKGGDPAVLGRLGEEVLALAEHGIPFEVVPGVTSATAVPELAGIPVTHRGVADSFHVATAHCGSEGRAFSLPPHHERTTLVLLMPQATAARWQEQLLALGYPRDLPVAFVSMGCSARERVVETTLARAAETLRDEALETPLLAVVGHVVSLRRRLVETPRRLGPGEARAQHLL